jgi:DNA helicase-2/ATP-dependent DNA helicase PcrA
VLTVNRPIAKPAAKKDAPSFVAGDRVKHPAFGEGEVLSVKPMGSDKLYEIIFDRVGTKKLMGSYAKLTKA